MLFRELNLADPLLKALAAAGYQVPTPIQEQAIPLVLQGYDLLGCAQTGTGKTAAFSLPILQMIGGHQPKHSAGQSHGQPQQPKALILSPTRELAIQIAENIAVYAKYVPLKHMVVFGGVNINTQITNIKKGVDILVATPGRLLDLIGQRVLSLEKVSYFVLDEADRMLDMGFIADIKKVVNMLPVKRQTLFFSATMPPEIAKLANTILNNPKRIEVTPVSTTAEKISQAVYAVEKTDKPKLLIHVIGELKDDQVLVFSRTKHGADRLVKILRRHDIEAEAIHGNKSQNARQYALSGFKTGKVQVLIATDIAARGIDVDDLKYVINYDLPNEPETYVHRIGRTGRAGASGTALSFCDLEEREYLQDIVNLIQQPIPVLNDHPYPVRSVFVAVPLPPRGRKVEAAKSRPKPTSHQRRARSYKR